MLRVALFTSAVLTFATLAGCGSGHPATYPVSGKVTFPDGKPLVAGTVEFRGIGGDGKTVSARGETSADGSYQLSTYADRDGAVPGKQQVIVIPPMDEVSNMDSGTPPLPIDRKFSSFETSGLEYTVKEQGVNTFDITVTPPARGR